MDPLILTVVLGAAAAGFVQGLAGFAFSMTAMALWAWMVAPSLAAPLTVFGALVCQLLQLDVIGKGFNFKCVFPMIAGGIVGVPIGAMLLPHIDQNIFRGIIGLLLAFWCPAMLIAGGRSHDGRNRAHWADGGAGLVGGILGGLAGLSGPAPTLWCVLRGWSRDVQRSSIQSFNLAMHIVTLIAYTGSGTITTETLRMFLVILPAVLIPTWLGTKLYARIDERTFRRVILVLLSMSGAVLLISVGLATLRR
jgi:uncharacterized membrane protein YfcA